MSRYLVNPEWPHEYRGHKPGEEFEANLEPDAEARAVSRGCITVLDDTRVKLDAKNVRTPQKRKRT